jgi:hypothetical protein
MKYVFGFLLMAVTNELLELDVGEKYTYRLCMTGFFCMLTVINAVMVQYFVVIAAKFNLACNRGNYVQK